MTLQANPAAQEHSNQPESPKHFLRSVSPLIVFSLSFFLMFMGYLLVQRRYLIGDFIYAYDDSIYLPRALFGQALVPKQHQLIYMLLDVLGPLGNLTLIKLLVLSVLATCAGLIALLFSPYMAWYLAVIVSIFVVSIPVDYSQVVFVTGAHPTFALMFILAALLVFERGYRAEKWRFVLVNVVVMLLLLASILASPVGRIMPLLHPLWLGVAWALAGGERRRYGKWLTGFAVAAMVGGVGYLALGMGSHHYTGLVGATNITLQQVFTNLKSSAVYILNATFRGELGIIYGVAVVALVGLGVWSLRRRAFMRWRHDSFGLLAIGINALLGAALAFGPTSILTAFVTRYVILAWVLALVALFAGLGIAVSLKRHGAPFIAVVLIALIGVNFYQLRQGTVETLFPRLTTYKALKTFIESERGAWSGDDQVLLLTSNTDAVLTVGYNHWSTWYLRHLADNRDIIGVIGPPNLIKHSPFIEQYVDHHSQFWEVVDGRSTRITMIGLEYDRSTYIYERRDGAFVPLDYLVVTDELGTHYIAFGDSYTESATVTLEAICVQGGSPLFFVWQDATSSSQYLCP